MSERRALLAVRVYLPSKVVMGYVSKCKPEGELECSIVSGYLVQVFALVPSLTFLNDEL